MDFRVEDSNRNDLVVTCIEPECYGRNRAIRPGEKDTIFIGFRHEPVGGTTLLHVPASLLGEASGMTFEISSKLLSSRPDADGTIDRPLPEAWRIDR